MFCTLAVVICVNQSCVQKPTPWIGGIRTQQDGGLTQSHCKEYTSKYNLTHENKLVCVCK